MTTLLKARKKAVKEAKRTPKPCNLATTLFPLQLGLLKTQSTGGTQAGSTMQPGLFFFDSDITISEAPGEVPPIVLAQDHLTILQPALHTLVNAWKP